MDEKETPKPVKPILKEYKQVLPFPSRLKSMKHERENEEIMDTFRKVKNAILQKDLPPKCKHPRIILIPCKLGSLNFSKVVCDLGTSINVFPFSIFEKLKLGSLQKTGTIIQLADYSTLHPKGVLEDVLVQVNVLIFPAYFYILDMSNLDVSDKNSIIFGMPFMETAKSKIDVFASTLYTKFECNEIWLYEMLPAVRAGGFALRKNRDTPRMKRWSGTKKIEMG
ncbi:hypothetical protein Lser_V15G44581 [Lactuca serriola]